MFLKLFSSATESALPYINSPLVNNAEVLVSWLVKGWKLWRFTTMHGFDLRVWCFEVFDSFLILDSLKLCEVFVVLVKQREKCVIASALILWHSDRSKHEQSFGYVLKVIKPVFF